ncbi:hypothetical protein [uncultured Prevotella sp.]|uniref:hypothetical protein n=1 Tax=uncultured Prevotella sp. TaxID=159272 RepID=UPI002605397B|nr:hypothetical protein [uncultured Prevotella sp.]
MKRMLLALALTAIIGINADAQRRGGQQLTPEQRVEKRMEMLDSKLKLSDEQKQSIKSLYTDFFNQDISREERRSKMDELNTKISSLLDENQQKAFSEMNSRKPGRKR